jgi:hypothetical protein
MRQPPICTVARLSKDSRGIGQMEHSVTPASALSGGQRSGRLQAGLQAVAELERSGQVRAAALQARRGPRHRPAQPRRPHSHCGQTPVLTGLSQPGDLLGVLRSVSALHHPGASTAGNRRDRLRPWQPLISPPGVSSQRGRNGPSGVAELQDCILVMLLQTLAAASAEFADAAWSWSLIFLTCSIPVRAVGACARPGHAWR